MAKCDFCTDDEIEESYTCEMCGRRFCERHVAEEDHHCDPASGYEDNEDEDEGEEEEDFTGDDIAEF
jgi:hypothetical protein